MVGEALAQARWWQAGVIYQIYPRSFQDSDGDGIGDLAGIERRLDHVVSLGIDAIWISPVFPSPMIDFGYDVADYCDIDPLFGTLAEFDRLLAAAHARGLRVLLDFVPNHTSDRHPWFVSSRSSRGDPRRDWYIWRDPAPGPGPPQDRPPNNWTSDMGGSSWEYDPATGQFYLHAFLKEQPDLNWRNAKVRAAMLGVMRFWFERGVDGFRIDVLWHIVKAEHLPDNPVNPCYHEAMGEKFKVLQTHSTDQPEVHAIVAEMRALADEFGAAGQERLLVGEIFLPFERLFAYYGRDAPGVHLPFNFTLIEAAWDAATLRQLIAAYEAALPRGEDKTRGWPNWVLGSHDAPRIAARIGEAQARVAAMLLLTLRGTPTLYQGDELGIGEVIIPRERVRDPQDLRQPGLGVGRDRSRTPMPWNDLPFAGFSTVEPWLPLGSDWPTRNVAAQDDDPASMLHLYRTLLTLRRAHPALSIGGFALLEADRDVLGYERRHGEERLIVALNLSHEPRRLDLPAQMQARPREVLCSTLPPRPLDGMLQPDEGLIVRIGQER